jgi:hypothetical protein
MNADFIVHYGRACMSRYRLFILNAFKFTLYSRTTRLPVLYVFGKKKIDVAHLVETICHKFEPETKLLVFYDVGYYYAIPELEKSILEAKRGDILFARVEKESKRQFHLAGREMCATGSCSTNQTFDTEAIICSDGNCGTCTPSEQLLQTTTDNTNPPPENTSTLTDSPTNTTTTSTVNTLTSTDTSTSTSSNETTLNGRSFELLPGTTLQDYTFLCIISF